VAFAIIPMLSLPTGAAAVSSGTVDPQVKLTWATALPSSFDLSGNVNFSRLSDAAGRYTEQAVSASLAHDLRGGWAGYWEVFGFMGSRQDYAPSWTVNTGVTHAVGRNAQIDVEIGRGISPAAPDWFVGAGVALRTAGVGRPR
jgi:hypothetical protein